MRDMMIAVGNDRDQIQYHTGFVCLMMVARSLRVIVEENKIRDELTKKSISTTDVVNIARKLNLKSRRVWVTTDSIIGQEMPAIAAMKTGEFIVITRVCEQGIVTFDPLQGRSSVMPMEDFFRAGSGELILLRRRASLKDAGNYFNLFWFIPVIIDKVLIHHGTATLDVLAIALVIFAVFQLGIGFLRTYLLTHTTNKIDMILGATFFRHLMALPLRYFELRRVGDTLIRVAAMNGIREFLTGSAMNAVLDSLFSVIFLANVILTPVYRNRLSAMWAAGAESNAFLVESVTGIHTVFINNSNGLIQRLSALSILWFGGHMVMEGQMTIGQLIAFQMLAGQANAPLLRLVSMWQPFQQTSLSVDRLGDVLNALPEPGNGSQPLKASLQGEVLFQNVIFRYSPELPPTLDKVSFSIQPGMRVGIVGRSGSGKSTLSKLVQRLYLPEAGQNTEFDPLWLRSQIGVVLQENYLFTGSVRDNIAIARPSAGMNEVIKVAQLAGAHEFILELPEDMIRRWENARQRIAIARSLLNNPKIVIFDEATSALDYESERIIMKNMEQIAQGRITLTIAHRLSSVRDCDLILVLDQGK
ncbi:hypothetical protein Lal_00000649, partial [Lupinus albus]